MWKSEIRTLPDIIYTNQFKIDEMLFNMTCKIEANKEQIDKWYHIKQKSSHLSKETFSGGNHPT